MEKCTTRDGVQSRCAWLSTADGGSSGGGGWRLQQSRWWRYRRDAIVRESSLRDRNEATDERDYRDVRGGQMSKTQPNGQVGSRRQNQVENSEGSESNRERSCEWSAV